MVNPDSAPLKTVAGLLPVETVIRERQNKYYQALTEADQLADATPFAGFMLQALLDTVREAIATDQVGDQLQTFNFSFVVQNTKLLCHFACLR